MMCLAVAACSCEAEEDNDSVDPKDCEHYWDNGKIIKEATVTETGKISYTCILCNATREENTTKKAHTHSYENAKWSSDRMNHWYDCAIDGCTVKGSKGTHQWDKGEILIESNPTTTGKKLFTCTECKYAKEEEYRAAATVTKEEYLQAITLEAFANVTMEMYANNTLKETYKFADGFVQLGNKEKVEEGKSPMKRTDMVKDFSSYQFEDFSYDAETRVYYWISGKNMFSLQFADGKIYSYSMRTENDGVETQYKAIFTNYGRTVIEE